MFKQTIPPTRHLGNAWPNTQLRLFYEDPLANEDPNSDSQRFIPWKDFQDEDDS